MISDAVLEQGLALTLDETHLSFGEKHTGKVRDSYQMDSERLIVATDRLSAFDFAICTLPFKGQVLNQLSAWWFEKTQHIIPNHFLSLPDPAAMRCMNCKPLPVEFVVRGYITGVTSTSMWVHYEKGAREFCGLRLPEGLKKNDKLPQAVLTPSTKGDKGQHDISVSRETLLNITGLAPALFDAAASAALRLFAFGQDWCAARGLILVDTKYEFGLDAQGTLRLIDEVHTPDSSRFWRADDYAQKTSAQQEPESYDKEFIRKWLKAQGYNGGAPPHVPDAVRVQAAHRYVYSYEAITGQVFEPNLAPPQQRLQRLVTAP